VTGEFNVINRRINLLHGHEVSDVMYVCGLLISLGLRAV
jgi:hypothetical protein